jgi:hypothetical protein
MTERDFKKGDRYEVIRAFEAAVLTMWIAPYTGGDNKLLPAGLRFVVSSDPPPAATAICADVEGAAKWEKLLVAEEEWSARKYTGYYLVVPFDRVEADCARLP